MDQLQWDDAMERESQSTSIEVSRPKQSMALVSAEAGQFRHLSRILRRVVGEVTVMENLEQLSTENRFNLITVGYDELSLEERSRLVDEFSQRSEKSTLVLLSEGSAQQDLARLFGSHTLTNLLVINNSYVDVVDLLVTIQKILLRDIFGLEKYFSWGIKPISMMISRASQRQAVLERLNAYTSSIEVPRRLAQLIHSAADEFLTNAIFNAPVDKEGNSRFSKLSRTEEVVLDDHEAVMVQFCCDGRRFGISTSDRFGSLSPEKLREYLGRCFRKESDQLSMHSGGAGLGFYHIFDALSHFVVNIRPGKQTEMIGLVDVSGSYKDFVKSGKSFNIFVSE